MKLLLTRALLWYATRRVAGSSIAMSGEEAKGVNCFSIYLAPSPSEQLDFRIVELVPQGVVGAVREREVFDIAACMSNEVIRHSHLVVHHFYKGHRIRYDGLPDFTWGFLTLFTYRHHLAGRINQAIFNRRLRFRTDRIELLRSLVDYKLKRAEADLSFLESYDTDSELDLFSELYGYRVFGHPAFEREYRRFRMLLESLEKSGEIIVKNNKITVHGKSLSTIAEYELEERRHRDLFRMQIVISILTAVLAGAAVFELLSRLQ